MLLADEKEGFKKAQRCEGGRGPSLSQVSFSPAIIQDHPHQNMRNSRATSQRLHLLQYQRSQRHSFVEGMQSRRQDNLRTRSETDDGTSAMRSKCQSQLDPLRLHDAAENPASRQVRLEREMQVRLLSYSYSPRRVYRKLKENHYDDHCAAPTQFPLKEVFDMLEDPTCQNFFMSPEMNPKSADVSIDTYVKLVHAKYIYQLMYGNQSLFTESTFFGPTE